MRLQRRLVELEKILGQPESCPLCHDRLLQSICIYEQDPDGTRRLVGGTPTPPCPHCGRTPYADGISEMIVMVPEADRSEGN